MQTNIVYTICQSNNEKGWIFLNQGNLNKPFYVGVNGKCASFDNLCRIFVRPHHD